MGFSPWGRKESDTTECLSLHFTVGYGLSWWVSFKESTCNAGAAEDARSVPGLERPPWRRAWQPTPVFLPGQRSRVAKNWTKLK